MFMSLCAIIAVIVLAYITLALMPKRCTTSTAEGEHVNKCSSISTAEGEYVNQCSSTSTTDEEHLTLCSLTSIEDGKWRILDGQPVRRNIRVT